MKGMHMITFGLVILGALNMGLIGIGDLFGFDLDLIYLIFGSWEMLEALVYILIGISAIMLVIGHKNDCKTCSVSAMPSAPGGAM